MKKILNGMFCVLKYVLLISAFVSTLYIVIYMFQRLEKDLTQAASVFIPYLLLFILFCINLVGRQKSVNQNIFYNICCCLVFATITYCGYRAIFDENLLLRAKTKYGIDFNFYNDFIAPMKTMLYGLSIANICFMFHKKEEKAPEIPVEEPVEQIAPRKKRKAEGTK